MARIREAFKYLNFSNIRGFWLGFLLGLVYFSYIFWWIWSVDPLASFGLESQAIALIISVGAFLMAIISMSLPWGLLGFLITKFHKNFPDEKFYPILFSSLFVLIEYLRSLFFSIFWYGSGGAIGPYWPFGNISYWLIDFDLISQSASIWGIYGINFFIAFATISLVLFITRGDHRKLFLLQFIISIGILFSVSTLSIRYSDHVDSKPIPVAIIQTNIPTNGFNTVDENLHDIKAKLTLVEEAILKIDDGIIVFPESANFLKSLGYFLNPDDIQNYFNKLSDKEILLIDNVRVIEEDGFRSRALYINSKRGALGFYDKQILTPVGEFLSYAIKWPIILFNTQLIDAFKEYREYVPGYGTNIFDYKDYKIQTLICSELISPQKAKQTNGDFVLILGSFSIWNNEPSTQAQAINMARFRAIENRKYIAFAANSAPSYIINSLGKIEKMTNSTDYELLTGTIVTNRTQTWYNYLGDWPILLISSVIFGLGVRRIRNDIKS